MELGQLRALREVQARGSIAAAALALNVTPSSVSQQLAALQRKAGTALTYKAGRRTALTPAGLALCRATVDVEVALARADAAVAAFRDSPSEPVSVAAFHSAGLAFFGPLAQALAGDGGPRLSFADQDVAQQDFAALTADYDVVVAHRLLNSPAWPGTVAVVPLAFEPLDVAVGATHRLAGRSSLRPSELRGERWISVHHGFALEGAIEMIGTLAGQEVTVAHRINEFFVAASVVEGGGCISLMPRFTVNRKQFPHLVLIPLAEPRLGRRIDILARPEALERAGVRQVVAALQAVMAELVEAGRGPGPILLDHA
ncbi:DNA-binding transcriptional LysR family regulator [Arthrobacter silviterrae]|uniref:LysR family transcriptional regulator n=1 Tax=Arthrobacter silviterrae TaxID=2026658 RepID=A0ABX0DHK2_9MICC|nr:LysR family transcriptional regulator [Arthrobacter silviterrae]MDQ0278184.1 DNA-binding transcriptional LysR family regulator [Arthrobacter silviterrae]NGN84910.1 LysR family transcriptional regulator [Arthrobacter silviterrae]